MQLNVAIEQIKAYQARLGYTGQYDSTELRMEHVRQLALAINVEVAEMLEWLPWKAWRPVEGQSLNVDEAALELIDIFIFTVDLWLALGLKPDDFVMMFETKLAQCNHRIDNGYSKVKEVPMK